MKRASRAKYKSAKVLDRLFKEYMKECELTHHLPNKAGLMLKLDIDRETWRKYGMRKSLASEYKKIEEAIQKAWTERLEEGQATGAIFYLKNAFPKEFRDRTEIEHSGSLFEALKEAQKK